MAGMSSGNPGACGGLGSVAGRAALLSFAASDIAGAIGKGILAADARGRELGDVLGKD